MPSTTPSSRPEDACHTILLVEDERDIREAIQEVLEFEGFQVETATNGKQALDMLRTIPEPCLVLLDFMMPVMNGAEFLDALRKRDKLGALPVVVCSAAGDVAANLPASGFMRKPVDIDVLVECVRRYC